MSSLSRCTQVYFNKSLNGRKAHPHITVDLMLGSPVSSHTCHHCGLEVDSYGLSRMQGESNTMASLCRQPTRLWPPPCPLSCKIDYLYMWDQTYSSPSWITNATSNNYTNGCSLSRTEKVLKCSGLGSGHIFHPHRSGSIGSGWAHDAFLKELRRQIKTIWILHLPRPMPACCCAERNSMHLC